MARCSSLEWGYKVLGITHTSRRFGTNQVGLLVLCNHNYNRASRGGLVLYGSLSTYNACIYSSKRLYYKYH